ncbi:MAG: phosphatidylglycerol lysyltransferase domain-containing protein [Desulfobacterales bacterium]|nr:phosphatidylglycerol lysyltransferase domain-containing protein [Desulfobacterales bacterium]
MNLNFESITLDHQEDYLILLAQCPQIASDYSFLNIWGWAEEYELRWAWDEELVWIRQSQPEEYLWAPVGSWDAVDWQSRLNTNPPLNSALTRVPEMLVNLWREQLSQEIQVAEERGNWDYVYRVADLIELKGKRYHKKKNLVNQFNRKYDFTYLPFGAEMVEQAMAMQTDWCTWRDCESSDILSSENRAIFKILKEWKQLAGLFGGALMVEDSMVAYTVAEPLTQDMLLIHFEKGDTQYKGIYQAINQLFLANSAAQYTLVNREQDLNDEGLRKAKLSYHPEDYIRKYRVTMNGTFA